MIKKNQKTSLFQFLFRGDKIIDDKQEINEVYRHIMST